MQRPVASIDEGVTAPMTVFRKTQPRPDGVYPVSQQHFPRQNFPRRYYPRRGRYAARRPFYRRQPRRFWRANAVARQNMAGGETNGHVQPAGPMDDSGNSGYHQLPGSGSVALPRRSVPQYRPYQRRPLLPQRPWQPLNKPPMRMIRKPTTVDIEGATTNGVRVQGNSNAYLSRGASINVRGQALVQVDSKSLVNAKQALATGDSVLHTSESDVDVHGHGTVHVHHNAPVFVAPHGQLTALGRSDVHIGAGSRMHVHGGSTEVSVNAAQ